MLDAHPPFQIDGNFGGTAAIAEMLLQSTENEIRLLPALPDAWDNGMAEGICARGGYVISMAWNHKILTRLNMSAKQSGQTILNYNGKQKLVVLHKGNNSIVL